jgi:hypothetical protein
VRAAASPVGPFGDEDASGSDDDRVARGVEPYQSGEGLDLLPQLRILAGRAKAAGQLIFDLGIDAFLDGRFRPARFFLQKFEQLLVALGDDTKVTEVGTLELWCIGRDGKDRWKLEFNVREDGAGGKE